MILPDIAVEPPAGWAWANADGAVLTIEAPGSGALQFSSPPMAAAWRGTEPRLILEEMLKRLTQTFGEVREMRTGAVPYGAFAEAECTHETFADVRVWLFIPETHDPLFVTWIADTRTDAGQTARELLDTIRPGLFSVSVRMAVEGARQNLAEAGLIEPITLLVSNGTITHVTLPFEDDALAVQLLRYERERLKAEVVAQIHLGEATAPDGTRLRVASIYVESADRRKHFVMDLANATTHEVEAAPPVADLFEPVDPELVAMLEASRR